MVPRTVLIILGLGILLTITGCAVDSSPSPSAMTPPGCTRTMRPIKDNRMGEESIMKKRWMKKSSKTADSGVHRNRPKSGHISSGKRSGNESEIHDGSADALQLHMVTRKDGRVNSVGLARLRHVMGLGH
jgi:hypothetical protein